MEIAANDMTQDTRPEFFGKRALVTGGTQGIGRAIAWRLASKGAQVVLNYSNNDNAAALTLKEFEDAGFNVSVEKADIGDSQARSKMLANIHAAGPIDLLVCNAAYQKRVGFFEAGEEVLRRTLEVNISGNFHIIQEVARHQIAGKRQGRIVLCSSGHGVHVFKDTLAYDVSKAALNHLMRCAALELIPHNIRVNAVDIGWTHTPGERRWHSEEEQNRISRTIPIGRSAQADEIAAVLEFLLSDRSSYVAGSLYLADGGFALRPNPDA
jgi:glucose 1-dehydrogenase